ncbi:nitrite reductase small subunit NirD [Pseudonocardia pini]|uniref:nitrite reductase small subunit NirD n=1 Tax=Pseudonocardia pini TaxID=2758030 RepID=UPI0015F0AD96|nr:nitrite reductase small subunit NirD [Pseudonocardia pini]
MTTAPEQVRVPVTWEDDVRWQTVCPLDRLQPERGVAALFGETQVAVFRLFDDRVLAIGNVDPRSGAAVMSRGIVGDRGGVPTVASPLYKEAYSLVDGQCLDVEDVSLPTYPVRVRNGSVQIGLP